MRKTQEIIIIGIALCLWWIVSSSAYADKAPNNSQTTGFVLTWCISRPLKVTAYYSPEAIQWVWFHGDYATEIKINGRGVRLTKKVSLWNDGFYPRSWGMRDIWQVIRNRLQYRVWCNRYLGRRWITGNGKCTTPRIQNANRRNMLVMTYKTKTVIWLESLPCAGNCKQDYDLELGYDDW